MSDIYALMERVLYHRLPSRSTGTTRTGGCATPQR